MSDIMERLRVYPPPDRTEIGHVQVAVDIMDAAAEIERLRDSEKMMVEQFLSQEREATAQAKEIERLRQETLVQSECIETLRGLLQEALQIDAGDFSVNVDEWIKRVREALGE